MTEEELIQEASRRLDAKLAARSAQTAPATEQSP